MSAGLFDVPVTPVQRLDSFCGDNEVWAKRDDLIPFCFGGNKARIARRLLGDMLARGATCMVAYGSTRSNLSRVMACACASVGARCVVITPSEGDGSRPASFNSALVDALGAEVVPCDRGAVRQAVEATMGRLRAEGEVPYYMYGDPTGRGNEAVAASAYLDAYGEIADQSAAAGGFDAIYLATGIGMTQGGLVAGRALAGGGPRIVGISVARPAPRAEEGVRRHAEAALSRIGGGYECSGVEVRDEYLHGGYGLSDERERETIASALMHEGIPMDETYVGKAFDGMLRDLSSRGICGERVLFLHTGGAPLFFDGIRRRAGSLRKA